MPTELNLDLSELGLGPAKKKLLPALRFEVLRELKPEDLVEQAAANLGTKPGQLKQVRSVHHHAARLLSTGMKIRDVAISTGMAPITITNLQNDPAFRELIEHYQCSEEIRFASVQERLRDLGLVATEEMMDRLLNSPEEIANKDLLEMLKATMDRSGNGPTSTQKSISLNLTSDDISSIKEVAGGEKIIPRDTKSAGRIIEHEPVGEGSAESGDQS